MSSPHLHRFTFFTATNVMSHLHMFSSSHARMFSYLRVFFLTIPTSTHFILTFSHLHMFSCWHPLMFTSTHLIFTSSHFLVFSSSHLPIFTFSHLPILFITFSHFHICLSHLHSLTSAHPHMCTHFPYFLSPAFFDFLLLGRGRCQRAVAKCNQLARNEVRSAKTAVKLRFRMLCGNHFARNWIRSEKLR